MSRLSRVLHNPAQTRPPSSSAYPRPAYGGPSWRPPPSPVAPPPLSSITSLHLPTQPAFARPLRSTVSTSAALSSRALRAVPRRFFVAAGEFDLGAELGVADGEWARAGEALRLHLDAVEDALTTVATARARDAADAAAALGHLSVAAVEAEKCAWGARTGLEEAADTVCCKPWHPTPSLAYFLSYLAASLQNRPLFSPECPRHRCPLRCHCYSEYAPGVPTCPA